MKEVDDGLEGSEQRRVKYEAKGQVSDEGSSKPCTDAHLDSTAVGQRGLLVASDAVADDLRANAHDVVGLGIVRGRWL